MKTRILIILKKREDYMEKHHKNIGLSTGLYNSALFIHEMLHKINIVSKLVVVNDNNDIDREVTLFKPTHVIIEALWVVPPKFEILHKLHPTVKWIIRLHSEIPFIANEGNAMNWVGEYVKLKNVYVAANSDVMLKDVSIYTQTEMQWTESETEEKIIYLPNYYPQKYKNKKFDKSKDTIDIGCFGAIRPLKNHLMQAISAVKFAEKIGKKLRFHINTGRLEQKGDSVYKNLKGLFDNLSAKGHELVNHEWTPRDEFLKICASMDMGMQCSFSETFNIVACDIITEGVPLVGTKEIPWMNDIFSANVTSSDSICFNLMLAYYFPKYNVRSNQRHLNRYTTKTSKVWLKYFTNN